MDFQLNEEQRIFKKMVHDLAYQRLAVLVPTWEKSGEFLGNIGALPLLSSIKWLSPYEMSF